MKIEELQEHTYQLRKDLQFRIDRFISETGCKPEIDTSFDKLVNINGSITWLTRVDVRIVLSSS